MRNGVLVRTLEELKENFDIESLLEYYESGKLVEWLESRYYDIEAQKVSELERSAENFPAMLCESLGLNFKENEVSEFDSDMIKRRVEKREHLKTLTDDEEILNQVDCIALTQEDLDTLIAMGEKKIYLCEGEFSIPLIVPDMTYIGLFHPCAVIQATDNVNFKEKNIVFQDMPFFWDVSGLTESDQSYQAEKLFMEGRYREAAEICEVLVAQDNPRALMLLYRILQDFLCHGLERIIRESFFGLIPYYRTKKSRYKNAGIKLNFAYSLIDGKHWENISRHKEVLRKIASDGTSFDKFYYGFLLYQEGFYTGEYDDEMIPVYREAADLGNPCAVDSLGNRYYYGNGVVQDYKKAFEWYQKAAEQGHVAAQCNIGICYYFGQGVVQDYTKAAEWFQKAAEQGNALAQHNIGSLYKNGQGVTQDYEKAMEWYLKAAKQGHADAQCDIGDCYYFGRGVDKSYEKAFKWYLKAAKQGHADAQCDIGNCYYFGRGVVQDYARAMEWYMKAAEQNYARAQNSIGACYHNGKGVVQDYARAMEWYMKAAEQGYATGQTNIGKLYYFGLGVNRDLQVAKKWFQKAADNGDLEAKDRLREL